jgi:2-dehydropantoate 2-reductase
VVSRFSSDNRSMVIAVVGAGGVGTFFGGLLVRGGQDVRFLARGLQLDVLRSRGIRIVSTRFGELVVPPVRATDDASAIGEVDLVLVCVKAHQTAAVLEQIAPLVGDHTIIVPLQNGTESDDVLADRFGRHRVATAVVYVGATLEQPGVVTHVAGGRIVLGARKGFDAARLPGVQDTLASNGCPVTVVDDIQAERWRKLMWNASFNPVSALAQRPPRDLLAVSESRQLIAGLMREVIAVARAQGITIEESEADDQVRWTDASPAIVTSMLVDRQRGRPMETDALVGIVVRKGRELGVTTPLSDAVYALLKAMDVGRAG